MGGLTLVFIEKLVAYQIYMTGHHIEGSEAEFITKF